MSKPQENQPEHPPEGSGQPPAGPTDASLGNAPANTEGQASRHQPIDPIYPQGVVDPNPESAGVEYLVGQVVEPHGPLEPTAGGGSWSARAEPRRPMGPPSRKRRVWLPIFLFLATCVSTFWVGALDWMPSVAHFANGMAVRRAVVAGWQNGLIYMGCVLAILFAHEMGHFVATLRYRIPASFPYFIPFPFMPLGTMGAVIGMEGLRANRKQLFDIGIAGPLAGLVIAGPVLLIGIWQLDPQLGEAAGYRYDLPFIVRWLVNLIHPQSAGITTLGSNQMNPYFMAGWVGLLVTGLNMLPLSQLDGGHVTYTLFGTRAHLIARTFLFAAIAYVVLGNGQLWAPMLVLVTFLGVDHPPTADDRVELGPFRTVLGYASLAIPVLCFPLRGLYLDSFWQ